MGNYISNILNSNQLTTNNNQLNKQVIQLTTNNDQLKDNNDQLKDKNDQLTTNNDKLNEQVIQLTPNNDQLNDQVIESTANNISHINYKKYSNNINEMYFKNYKEIEFIRNESSYPIANPKDLKFIRVKLDYSINNNILLNDKNIENNETNVFIIDEYLYIEKSTDNHKLQINNNIYNIEYLFTPIINLITSNETNIIINGSGFKQSNKIIINKNNENNEYDTSNIISIINFEKIEITLNNNSKFEPGSYIVDIEYIELSTGNKLENKKISGILEIKQFNINISS